MQVRKQLSLLSSSLLILGLLVASCNKDKVPVPDSGAGIPDPDCQDIVFWGTDIIDGYVNTGDQYMVPTFSPFSDDEFIYIKLLPPFEKQLVKYNIQTETEQILCSTADIGGLIFGSRPDWGSQHWIVFSVGTGSSSKCFKIMDDGSGLEQITPNGVDCNLPRFNQDGDRFVVMGSTATLGNPYRPIYDLTGSIVDSVLYDHTGVYSGKPYTFNSSIHDGLFYFVDQNVSPHSRGFGLIQSNGDIDRIFSTDGYGDVVTEVGRYQDVIYFLADKIGLYSYNMSTNQITLEREMCDTRHIQGMSISQLSGKLLIEEVQRTKVDEFGGVDEQSNIMIFDPFIGETEPVLIEE